MFVGIRKLLALAAAASFNLQHFTDDDPELGPPLEIDVESLGDDPGRLKSMLGKALHENRRIRNEAGKRRTALRAAEADNLTLKGKVGEHEAKITELNGSLETANRANGQYRANFKARLVDGALKDALKAAGAIDVDLVAGAIPKDKITCDDETFAVGGVDDVVKAFQADKAHLFGKQPVQPSGTSRTGAGPANGSMTENPGRSTIDYSDTSKSLEQLERESNMQMFGRATIGGGA